jgi:hypothetical protein
MAMDVRGLAPLSRVLVPDPAAGATTFVLVALPTAAAGRKVRESS